MRENSDSDIISALRAAGMRENSDSDIISALRAAGKNGDDIRFMTDAGIFSACLSGDDDVPQLRSGIQHRKDLDDVEWGLVLALLRTYPEVDIDRTGPDRFRLLVTHKVDDGDLERTLIAMLSYLILAVETARYALDDSQFLEWLGSISSVSLDDSGGSCKDGSSYDDEAGIDFRTTFGICEAEFSKRSDFWSIQFVTDALEMSQRAPLLKHISASYPDVAVDVHDNVTRLRVRGSIRGRKLWNEIRTRFSMLREAAESLLRASNQGTV
jgi:hypothetical protein